MSNVLNSETISAATLVLIQDMAPSKVSKHLKLLNDDDLGTYRENIESKTNSIENLIKQSNEGTAKEEFNTISSSLQTELLACYGILQRIDALFIKRERDEEKSKNKGRHQKSVLERVNEKLSGGSSGKY
jgi:hypothetical protein